MFCSFLVSSLGPLISVINDPVNDHCYLTLSYQLLTILLLTAVNGQSFLCPLSMATGYLSVLLQSLGVAAYGLWCSYNRQGAL